MTQPITDCAAFLADARQAVDELSLLKDRETQLIQEESRLEKTLQTEKKNVAETINQTIRKRSEEISSSYDHEINRGQERLKKAKAKREKAKNQGIRDRIKEETAPLYDHNRELKTQLKTLLQRNHVPSYCNSNLYYSLFFPRSLGDFLRILTGILICFLAIPFGSYLLIPNRSPLHLAAIYLAAVLVFGGLYIMIGNKTKLFYTDTLKKGVLIRDQIRSNNKKIRVLTSTIRKDKNESLYDLERYDDEITRLEHELAEIAEKKKDALNTFETVTKAILTDEIESNSKPKIDKLSAEYEQVRKDTQAVATEIKEQSLTLTDQYETYLGKEFMDAVKLAELSEIVRSGQAVNLSDAISKYREKEHHPT